MHASNRQPPRSPLSPPLRWALLVAGLFAVALGVIGIFLPLLPTVPFLLLALACFARSSARFHAWLLDHARLGPMVRPYLDGRGIPHASKARAILLVWASIALSALLLVARPWLQAMLLVIAICLTLYLLRLPSAGADRCDAG